MHTTLDLVSRNAKSTSIESRLLLHDEIPDRVIRGYLKCLECAVAAMRLGDAGRISESPHPLWKASFLSKFQLWSRDYVSYSRFINGFFEMGAEALEELTLSWGVVCSLNFRFRYKVATFKSRNEQSWASIPADIQRHIYKTCLRDIRE